MHSSVLSGFYSILRYYMFIKSKIKSNLLGKYQLHCMYVHIDISDNIHLLTFKGGTYVYIHLFSFKRF